MKKIIFPLLVVSSLLCSLSCNPLRSYQKREGCVEFYERIENRWKYNDSSKVFYWIPDPEVSDFWVWDILFSDYYNYCIKGMPKKSVLKLLGEPSDTEEKPNHYYYYLNRKCFNKRGRESNHCNYIIIAFDKNDEAVSMRIARMPNSHY